jgi:hypothetical protein
MDTTLIIVGIACVIGAIVGGGVKVINIEMRSFESLWRQLLLAVFGAGLILFGLNMRKEAENNRDIATNPGSANAEPDGQAAQNEGPAPDNAAPAANNSQDFQAGDKSTYVGPKN